MSFKLLKSETQTLTPEYLSWFLALEDSPLERNIKQSRIDFLREKAAAKHVVPFHWVTARPSWNDHSLVRINGHHSSTMLSKLPSLDPGWSVHYDEFEVDKPEDMALLFRQLDARQSARSAIDVCASYQGLCAELKTTPTDIVKLGTEAVFWFFQNSIGTMRNIKGDDRYQYLIDHPEIHRFLIWIGEKIYSVKTPELKRAPIAAALFGTFEHAEEDAREFWASVAKGGGMDDDNPAAILDEWLKATLSKDKLARLKPANFWNACVYAWNAFRDERGISSIPSSDKGFGTGKGLHEIA